MDQGHDLEKEKKKEEGKKKDDRSGSEMKGFKRRRERHALDVGRKKPAHLNSGPQKRARCNDAIFITVSSSSDSDSGNDLEKEKKNKMRRFKRPVLDVDEMSREKSEDLNSVRQKRANSNEPIFIDVPSSPDSDRDIAKVKTDDSSRPDSDNVVEAMMEEDVYVGLFQVGCNETFRDGRGSIMLIDEYDAMDMKGYIPLDRMYEERQVCHDDQEKKVEKAIDLLVDSTLSDKDIFVGPRFEKAPAPTKLPLKFSFRDPTPPPEKEPWEIETEYLFSEMHLCLAEISGAKPPPPPKETEESLRAKSPSERCRLDTTRKFSKNQWESYVKSIARSPRKRNSFLPSRDEEVSKHDHNDIPLSYIVDEDYFASMPTQGSVLDLIPDDTRKRMYDHQLEGFKFLWNNVVGESRLEKLNDSLSKKGNGCIISHAPGTGKTYLSIVFILTLMRVFPYIECRPVVVAPKSILSTWEREFEKRRIGIPFHNLNSEVNGFRTRNGLRKLKLCSWMRRRSVLGVSYDLFRTIARGPMKDFLLQKPGLLVLDEGHTARNEGTFIWKALMEVKTRKRIILSGTPFQNSLKELKATLELVNPGFSSNSDLNWKNWKKIKSGKEDDVSIAKIKEILDPIMHVQKSTILHETLPGLKEMFVILKPTAVHKRALEAILSDTPNNLKKMHLVSLASVVGNVTDSEAGLKTKFVMQLVRLCNAVGEKVLIFSEFIGPLEFPEKMFKDEFSWREGREVLYMDGKQSAKKRQSSIDSFNDGMGKVFLASTGACSEGVSLVGASRVVLLDVDWNPSVDRQAISRAFRLGQTKVVYVYHLITTETLEVRKHEIQTSKDELAELVLSSRDVDRKRENIDAAVAEDKILELMMDDKVFKDMFEEIVHKDKFQCF